MRLLLDTNVLISYLLQPRTAGAVRVLINTLLNSSHTVLLPEHLLQELVITITTKPRLAQRISADDLTNFVAILETFGETIPSIREPFPAVTRDPKDDYLLAYAVVGEADFLVTGDDDLLSLAGQIPNLAIISPSQFVAQQSW
jgi:putative PIN family toxin of toxin-antitoxin system